MLGLSKQSVDFDASVVGQAYPAKHSQCVHCVSINPRTDDKMHGLHRRCQRLIQNLIAADARLYIGGGMTATNVAQSSDRLRHVLGPSYAIDRELGRGGMATVYLAQDLRHDRLVALKVLHREVAEALGVERFLREIKTAARLNHPHILPLFDSGAAEEFLYYVMPYVEGESLRQNLDRLGQIPVEDAIAYAQEVAAALDYAHRQGIVHRDIKPENVMLHEGIAMLMDFGIAKGFNAAAGITSVGMIVGTPAYMSPEQAFAESDIDGRSDQYSLACMLHEMVTGEPLFKGSTPQAMIAQRISTSPDLSRLEDRVPDDVVNALRRALSLEPAYRYETVREFAANLTVGGRSTPVSMRAMSGVAQSAAKSVAVLPFENLSADADNEYLAAGIAEEIIGALSKIRTLRVASRATSFAFKERRADIHEVGQKLKVSTVLSGSVRKSGNRIRVTAELTNVSDGSQLWAERYDREMEDVFEIQDHISEAIVRALRIILGDAERKALKAKTRDLRAYEYYLRGRQYVDLRRKSIEYAIEMFKRAVEVDPDFALAHAGIGDTLSLNHLVFDTNPELLSEAKLHAEKALELDPDLAEAHLARGMVYSCMRDYEVSNRAFETAMRLDPKLFEVPSFWGRNLIWQGQPEEAIRVFRIAQQLRPESYDVASMLGIAYSNAGRPADAEAARRHSLKLMEDWLALNPDDARAWILSATQYASKGDRARTENAVRRALAIDDDAMILYNVGCAYAQLSAEDAALDYLEQAIAKGWHNREWLRNDPDFAAYRESPRFRKIMEAL